MHFPASRPRRLRRTRLIRDLVAETRVYPRDLIFPLFVKEGLSKKEPIEAMPGQYRFSLEELTKEVNELVELGIRNILLFGIPERKDEIGSSAYDREGIVQRTIKKLRDEFSNEITIFTDVCLCQYTTHGHCGVVIGNSVDNDETLKQIAKIAVSHAEAGSDVVAPSGMMDGAVRAIREALDDAGYKDTAIMSYSSKYASVLYGPFREAASSAPKFGDRRGYQMDPRNSDEALREALLDIQEGADIIMVKPATWYLDIIKRLSRLPVPLAAYNVSGEYSMIKLAGEAGFFDEKMAVWEILHSIKRAGADIIITYFAKDYAKWLRSGEIIP
ncbi:porphobilinogen synthase [Candidatus Methanodesulfokora washburnensis]|uniref:Delta-aminolevulinic acid dehydratase n=1 Tax=Candidatus Methanodesulfokora washburnensis TaxID=2478471 RepID=A0A429GGS4_9CREN|nr:porphobilinogen synthase [Candidatus Methanodesulfokores washburnensis]RSN73112.1 porphobilinogen synthase [Candidatus Methanodesulfokores washburnensis]